jgi:hypothetical protein
MVFYKILQILQMPGEYSDAVEEVWGDGVRVKLLPTSPMSLRPGDIIAFSYKGRFNARRLLVVGTNKNPDARFKSTRDNLLLCSYEIEETLPKLVSVFSTFYNNRGIRYEHLKNTMASVFGLKSYKTFNIGEMLNIYKIQVIEKK